jgi:hypothetical protein
MALTEDIAWVGSLIDAYAVGADRMGVASNSPGGSGVPPAMQVGQVDAEGWVEWRVLPSTLSEADLLELETKFRMHLPPLFRAYLLARLHMFDQVTSRRYDQLILMTDTPAGKPLAPLLRQLSAWRPLIDAGFIPFAEWGDGWGPMCFDTSRRVPDGDCPVIWMDHEVLVPLGKERWRIRETVLPLAQPLYDSFRDLLLDVFGGATKLPGADASEPPRNSTRARLAARILQFWRRG